MCDMVIHLECIYVPYESDAIDTYVKWLIRLSISKSIDKVSGVFQFDFVGTYGLDIMQSHTRRRFMIETWSCAMNYSNIPTFYIW